MTPPGNGSGKPPRLTLVANGEPIAVPESVAPETPSPPSATEESFSLPPRSAAAAETRAIIADNAPTLNLFQQLSSFLTMTANRTALGGFDVRIPARNGTFHIQQDRPNTEIRVRLLQERRSASSSTSETIEVHRLTYLPDGRLTSTYSTSPHTAPARGAEYSYHNLLNTALSERTRALLMGEGLFFRLRNALGAFRSRYSAETQSAWYDRFVVHEGRAYSFRRPTLLSLSESAPHPEAITNPESMAHPQLLQVEVFEETGTEKVRIATLSANGESEFRAGRDLIEPLRHGQLALFESLTASLEEAVRDPKAYETRLRGSLASIGGLQGTTPTLERSVDIHGNPSLETSRGYVADFRNGWDLARGLVSSRRWQNPQNMEEVQYLRPNWRIGRAMSWELLRWMARTSIYALFDNIRSPKMAEDRLRLELHAGGGSQLTIYRNSQIHDILIAGANGTLWRANQEIRQLDRNGVTFPNRTEALRAAVARYNPESVLPVTLQVQDAPTLDLNNLHLDATGAPRKITTASQAWDLLRAQLPPGVEPRVEFRTERGLLSDLFTAGEPSRIHVDFRESQPSLSLDIRHQAVGNSGAEVPHVQIIMRRGEDRHARVFEDGVPRPEVAQDIHQASLRLAMEGNVPRHWATRLGQGLLRGGLFVYSSGRAYGVAHFLALPFQWAHERLVFNDFERRTIGTPGPSAQLSWDNITRNLVVPYGIMSTGASVGSVMVDGIFNAMPGIRRSFATWHTSEATLGQAWRFHRPGFFNPSPLSRPIGPNFWFRGFLQRAVPLFMGVIALDRHYSGQWMSPMFWRTTRDLAAVSAGSAGLLRLAYASPRISGSLLRRGLLTEATAGLGGARFSLTLRGQLAITVLEMAVLGIINAHERRAMLEETGRGLRNALGSAIDRRNELITRLERGEEIPARHLLSADAEVHNAHGIYRRFLELTEHTSGTGSFPSIGGGNDFDDEMRRYERELALLGETPDPLSAARLASGHRERLAALTGRYERMESDLDALYARYGVEGAATAGGNDSLRELLQANAGAGSDPSAPPAVPAPSPVTVDSEEGRAILEQLRWKAADDPGSVLWSRERRADYILAQFRGYRVADAEGGRRPWDRADAMAFLDAVDQANVARIRNLEAPLTMPGAEDRFDTRRLQELIAAERAIRDREASGHGHSATHAASLAGNTQDLDGQMAAYYRSTNERTEIALNAMMGGPTLAMADGLEAATIPQ